MLYYQEGFCNGYRQSMPVVYEKGSDGKLHKSKKLKIAKTGRDATQKIVNVFKMHRKQ